MSSTEISSIRRLASSETKHPSAWRQRLLKTAAVLLAATTFLSAVPLGANAAPRGSEKSQDDKKVTSSTLVRNPDRRASELLNQSINEAKAQDPDGFDTRVRMIYSSKAVSKYVASFKGLDRDIQVSGLAASMPTEALAGMVDLMEKKIVEYKVRPASASSSWVTMTVHKDLLAAYSADSAVISDDLGQLTARGWGSLPQCPSAWAAFWAWFAFNTAFCGPFAAYPPAAVACALGLGLGGMILDFNRGC
jgi:hypothetical protein